MPGVLRACLLAVLAAAGAPAVSAAQALRIYDIDVEQAAATLIVSPSGHTLLVDSGKNGHGPRILAALQAAGVASIDHFVATHYHEDHYGGIDEVVRAGIAVKTAYDRGDKDFLPTSTTSNGTFKDYQAAVGSRAKHLIRGDTIPLDPAMSVLCISSGGVVLGEPDPVHPGKEENDMSLGLLITYGRFRFWVGGDVETATESKIADLNLVRDVDLYQANHHGADNGSTAEFLGDMKPTVVIISNGDHGGFRHPRASTLARMGALVPPPVIFQTNRYLHTGDDGGNVPTQFIADPQSVDSDGTILVTVPAVSDSFTVTFGSFRRAFALKQASGPGPDADRQSSPRPDRRARSAAGVSDDPERRHGHRRPEQLAAARPRGECVAAGFGGSPWRGAGGDDQTRRDADVAGQRRRHN